MFARIPSVLLPRQGRSLLLLALAGLPLVQSCTKSEDTEAYVPASEGAKQPGGAGSLLPEDQACDRLRAAAVAADKRLRCDNPELAECPGFVRPGGGSGCYEYLAESVRDCEKSYADVTSCGALVPCVATAVRNDELESCELRGGGGGAGGVGGGGAPGEAGAGGAADAGAGPLPPEGEAGASNAGAPATGGAGG